jgi:hypothetical protein
MAGNSVARARLLSRPELRQGTDYGFDADELARIRDEFPRIEVLYNIDSGKMQVWSIGEYGDQPMLFDGDLQGGKAQYSLHDRLRAAANAANAWKFGDYTTELNRQIDGEREASVNEMVAKIDPHRLGTAELRKRGQVAPVSMAVSP